MLKFEVLQKMFCFCHFVFWLNLFFSFHFFSGPKVAHTLCKYGAKISQLMGTTQLNLLNYWLLLDKCNKNCHLLENKKHHSNTAHAETKMSFFEENRIVGIY